MTAMERKVVCVLLVVCSLALSTLAQGQTETCRVAPSQRKNCGFPTVTPQQCADKGCCFDSSIPGYPWCFYPTTTHENLPAEECEF